MATGQALVFNVASFVEDVLKQHGTRLSDIDLVSRKAEEASLRRYEAAGWLRKAVGVVAAKDLPAEPSEEDFRLGLRSGIILCNVLNKVQSGAVPKVVEGPCDSVIVPDGAALSAYQYFENVRNFLVAVEEMGLPTFEASDLEQGGKSLRIVNCVLALKSYSDWKQSGGNGSWKYGGNCKPPSSGAGKLFLRKQSEPFTSSFSRTTSFGEKSIESLSSEMSLNSDLSHDFNEAGASRSLNMLVRGLFSDKKQEEIPMIVESMLCKVMEEFERRLASQNELMKTSSRDLTIPGPSNSPSRTDSMDINMEDETPIQRNMKDEASRQIKEEECYSQKYDHGEEAKGQLLKQKMLVEQQLRDIQELKHTLHTTKVGMQFMQIKYLEDFSNLGNRLESLSHAALGYKRVLEENRKLYNQLQDLKGNIRVYCRVRPFLSGQPNCLSTVGNIDDGNITIITPLKYVKEGRKSFSFNKVFGPSATQEEVFSDTQPLIRSVLDGYNVCIFAYGQTGSGKTYTMTGPKELTEESLGVNYRALSDLFLLSEQRRDTICYNICVQMLEIYNEQVRDLLGTDGLNKRLEIRNSSQNGINVPDANVVPVQSTSDVINLMNLGQKNRAVCATALNDRSSRSHSCLTVHVQGRDLTSGTTLRGSMHLVDLAGSERVDKSEVTGDRLKEAQYINKSLSALGDVIASLAHKNSHVPYRNSKLTQLLQDSLGGQAKTLMFVHISPESNALGETISTLKFAERVATVELGAARVNKEGADVKELKEEIASLKAALARKEGETHHLQYSRSSTPERSRMKSGGSTPSHRSWHGGGMSNGHRQPMDDVCNIEVLNNSESKLKRRSLDPQDLLRNSPLGSPLLSGKEDDKDLISGDWVDKIMVNKLERFSGNENPATQWEINNIQLPEVFYQSCLPDSTNIYPEQPYSGVVVSKKDNQDDDLHRCRYEVASTDDSDHEAATSDCSEPDSLWQLHLSKVTNIPNPLGSKTKRPQLEAARGTDTRSSIPSSIPAPRKLPNGVSPASQKTARQLATVVGKRKTANAK
ncbi:Kinesin domain-containing protein/CH domain-containing protein [Cephalotus follicularis]|uniref:Kinesin domain-containing protein/CH domain-containing protein n=1 Tax=Cephalotus follicularis TaxID=3775 RepID=A0A1Q3BEA9_CEPFO|nr:Kinesin domain-containing protein/CH domain-containing protein [Cephalotus follicularis]